MRFPAFPASSRNALRLTPRTARVGASADTLHSAKDRLRLDFRFPPPRLMTTPKDPQDPLSSQGQGALGSPASEQEVSALESSFRAGEVELEGDGQGYRVKLPSFEGPLDLLLHLIQKHELDILDIPIGFVTEKYLEFLQLMEATSIDVASDYLVMAATLAYIKSKSLLPPDPNAAEEAVEEDDLDPRAELVRRLLEYQKYKQAASDLGSRDVLGRDVFPRGIAIETAAGPPPLAQMSLFNLLDAFQRVLERTKQGEEHKIDFELITITDRIGEVNELLRFKRTARFEELFAADATRLDLIITFLAVLEMTRLRMIRIVQESPEAQIFVELRTDYAGQEDDGMDAESAEAESSDSELPELSDAAAQELPLSTEETSAPAPEAEEQ